LANNKSAQKRVITSEKNRMANRAVRSAIRSTLKKIRTADKKEVIVAEMPKLFSMLDKAAQAGKAGITKNTASNYKRKIHKLLTTKAA
jgi:small subunit ribosomal protein S20